MSSQLNGSRPGKSERRKRKAKANVKAIGGGDAEGGGISFTLAGELNLHAGKTEAPDILLDDLKRLEEEANVQIINLGGARADGGKITLTTKAGVLQEINGASATGGQVNYTKGQKLSITGGVVGAATSDAAALGEVLNQTGAKRFEAGNATAAGAKVLVKAKESDDVTIDEDSDFFSEGDFDDDDDDGDEAVVAKVEGAVVTSRMR